ncbi:hypothetical protein Rhopal_006703-T1 [Rhodotorula paludigena]|uniref:Uncharacterized protein n=1 Tax=Rhodotorula paludigena TaxID=86838 RepID=A0AAV5GM38_9BASI|nr:hypothetical protein Rhopal_006703-T1 [Rhodotorula paludigena]
MDQNDLEALLATLRQAQDGGAPAPGPPAAVAPPTASHQPAPSQGELDSLLSTLTALPSGPAHAQPVQHAPPPPTRAKDHSALSFHEALPILNSLAMDPHFLEAVEEVWDEQKTWELRMKDERNRLDQELGRSGANPVVRSQKLREWDRGAVRKWQALQTSQQGQLQSLGVPTFQKTTDPTLLKRQERVLAILVGFLEDRGDGA